MKKYLISWKIGKSWKRNTSIGALIIMIWKGFDKIYMNILLYCNTRERPTLKKLKSNEYENKNGTNPNPKPTTPAYLRKHDPNYRIIAAKHRSSAAPLISLGAAKRAGVVEIEPREYAVGMEEVLAGHLAGLWPDHMLDILV